MITAMFHTFMPTDDIVSTGGLPILSSAKTAIYQSIGTTRHKFYSFSYVNMENFEIIIQTIQGNMVAWCLKFVEPPPHTCTCVHITYSKYNCE
jgi:hypothetical protein